ncbi:motile sperm domain-containing protein 1-like [Cylas formicarius]|uniref:motile sperm domain-containing protein 1-like n=1 Tax=Cylas formicarius TaxID=197179 RepID=UPI0029588779|nr:motile sperm domain-containing protein 1-like [Cylas formicarius]
MDGNARQIPVFAFPNCLKFFLGSRTTHTQVLSLYSPYDFPVRFKVHCHANAWDKYTVTNPEGVIGPQSTVDLVVTHKAPLPHHCNVVDRFKIVIFDKETDQTIGKKYVESVLLSGEKDGRSQDDDFEFHSSESGSRAAPSVAPRPVDRPANNIVASLVVAACAAVLFLPADPEPARISSLPTYLHVSHKTQLLAALLLGVFLCVLVRN